MKIAYITTYEQGQSDVLLSQVADTLAEKGLCLSGVVQINSSRPDCHRCDMDVAVLPDGPTIRISQSLGREAKGCKLDPSALETAVVEVERRMDARTDLLILNKFGKHEADGRGFRDVIAKALSEDIPILTAVNQLNEKAFLGFADGFATKLPADINLLSDWAFASLTKTESAA